MKFLTMLVSVFSLCFLLVACSQKTDEIYLFNHPIKLKNLYMECQQNIADKNVSCHTIEKTFIKFNQLVEQLVENPQAFGKHIIELQIAASKLKNQIDQQEQYSQLQYEIQLRLLLMAKAEGL